MKLLILAGIGIAGYWLWPAGALRYPPGVLVADEPNQSVIPQASRQFDGFQITAVASYQITARVLHTKRYWSGPTSRLVPVDVAVGWGPMSDQSVLDHLEISQTNRFFFYEWSKEPPVPPAVLASHAANMHVIAGGAEIAKAVKELRAGELVAMSGCLVNVSGPDGFQWNSSLTRDDVGNGACELFYVTALETLPVKF